MLASSIYSLLETSHIKTAPSPFFWVLLPIYVGFILSGLVIGIVVLYKFITGGIKIEDVKEWISQVPWAVKNAWPIFAILIVTQLVFIFSLRLLRHFNLLPTSRETVALLTSLHGIVFHIFSIILIYVFCHTRKWSLSKIFGLEARTFIINFGRALLAYLISLPAVVGLSIIVNIVMFLQGKDVGFQEVIFVFSTPASFWNLIFLVLLAVIFAPVAEEMLFRGILLPILAKKIGVVLSVIITSLFFAAIHMHLQSLLPLFALSLALALSYLYWRNLMVPICIHAIFNLISVSLVLSSNLLPK